MQLCERLTLALNEKAPPGIRGDKKALQTLLNEEMGPANQRPGTSYPAILGYFAGRTMPSIEWVEAAAKALGVRMEWLAFGSGAPTEEEETRARGIEAAVKSVTTVQDHIAPGLTQLVGEAVLGLPQGAGGYAASWAPGLAELWLESGGGGERAMVEALAAPLVAFGLDTEELGDMGRTVFRDYMLSMVPVLLRLQAEQTRQHRRLVQLTEGLPPDEAERFYTERKVSMDKQQELREKAIKRLKEEEAPRG